MKTRALPGLLGLALFGLAAVALAQDDHPRLEGVITTADGSPAANALVVIYTAAPRDGEPSAVCPSCHPDCGKRVRTDAQGRFLIEPVQKDLLYRLLVSAPGHRPDYIKDADPQFGGAHLKLKRLKQSAGSNRVVGKLIDPSGKPVAGARIEVGGTRYGNVSYSSSTTGKVDPLAVSDESGVFFLDCTNEISALTVTIEPHRLARQKMWLETGKAHLIRLKPGATVTGRLLNGEKPVANALVSMSTQERSSDLFMTGFNVSTDSSGRFTLANVPANTRFMIYTRMKEMEAAGVALPPTNVTTTADGGTVQLGDVQMIRTHTFRGRVLLEDGQPVPARTRIYLSLENAFDSQNTTLDPDGWFEFQGVPADAIDVTIRLPGYQISAKNPNKDWLNEGRLVGRLQKDFEEFYIHMEKGKFERNDAPPGGGERQPRQKPMESAKL